VATIHDRIVAKLHDGFLPQGDAVAVFAGSGTGALCAGCDEVIRHAQVEYELLFDDGSRASFHLSCAELWRGLRMA
jgi:hypothetical protein